MDAFLAWPGWAGVSGIAQVVALVTLIGAAWRFILQRRQMPMFALDWVVMGSTELEGKKYHVVEFHNVGRGTGVIHMLEFFGANVNIVEKFVTPRVLQPGHSFRLLLTAPKVSDVWFRSMIRMPEDRTRFVLTWFALSPGELDEQRASEARSWRWWSRLYQFMAPKPVGPGAAIRGAFRAGKRDRVRRVIGDFSKEAAIYSLGTLHKVAPEELPFYRTQWNREAEESLR